jgi:hypothetical protein
MHAVLRLVQWQSRQSHAFSHSTGAFPNIGTISEMLFGAEHPNTRL